MKNPFEMPTAFDKQKEKEIPQSEVEKVLEGVDFSLLKEIYAEQARRSGIDPEQIGFVEREGILEKQGSLSVAGASYSLEDGRITLEANSLVALAYLNKKELENQVLEFLCHEEAHAVSYNMYEEEEGDVLLGLVKKRNVRIQSGFDQRISGQGGFFDNDVAVHFRWFNEGVTDELGAQAYVEYLKRSSIREQKEYSSKYPLARLFVRTFCERIGEECGVPKDIVWQAVVREYLHGRNLLEGEVAELLNEVFSEKFTARLARADTNFLELGPIVMAFREILDSASTKKVFLEIVSKIKNLR